MYVLYPKVGNMVVGNPVSMTADEYHRYMLNNQLASYYREKSATNALTSVSYTHLDVYKRQPYC